MPAAPADVVRALPYSVRIYLRASSCNVKFSAIALVVLISCLFSGSNLLAQNSVESSKTNSEKSLTAIVFLAVDCPISQKYVGELKHIDSLFQSAVTIKGILPGKLKQEEVDQFINEYNIDFPIAVDREYEMVKKYNATITPEVFLIDNQNHIHYQGAIDNWFFDLGKYRQQITQHYLIDAIHAALEGKSPTISKTESVGCIIQRPSSKKHSK